jgi:hypothetical protein
MPSGAESRSCASTLSDFPVASFSIAWISAALPPL